jgi:hypothetical protein
VSAERVLGHQLRGDLFGQFGIQTALDVDGREFRRFKFNVRRQFFALAFEIGIFGIRLGTDRNIFASRHGHRTRDQAGQARDQHAATAGFSGSYADNQAGRGNDAVVRTKDGSTEPADAMRAMEFGFYLQNMFRSFNCRR